MSAVDATVVPVKPRRYGWSVLWSGLRGLGRAWLPIGVAVVLHALLQSVLTVPGAPQQVTVAYVALCALSYLLLLAAVGLVAAAALEAVEGCVSLGAALARLRAHGRRYVLWASVVIALTFAGMLVFLVPGIVMAAATPFVALAALDGRANPLAVDLRVIRERFGRWLLTAVLMALPVLLAGTFAALVEFFIRGWPASVAVWLVVGVLAAWFQCAWAFLYRSTRAGAGR